MCCAYMEPCNSVVVSVFKGAKGCVWIQSLLSSWQEEIILWQILFQYEKLIEDFKVVHKGSEMLRSSGYSTSELRADIDTMEREKDIVVKRIERMQQKVWNRTPSFISDIIGFYYNSSYKILHLTRICLIFNINITLTLHRFLWA